MLVIADTSPLIGLIKIGLIEILPRLYGSVVVPDEVANELAAPSRPAAVQAFMANRPTWLSIRSPRSVEMIPDVDRGERAAICLALELNADLLVIDDRAGRKAALDRHIRTAHTTALLLDAANAGIVPDLQAAFDRLRATNFRVSGKTLDELLRRHNEHRRLKGRP
jgi:predicted nucleic acid-binding protein